MTDTIERELGWDDNIQKESEFTLLPEGDYDFTVKSFTRGKRGAISSPLAIKRSLKLKSQMAQTPPPLNITSFYTLNVRVFCPHFLLL